jgi:hypothetical protein
MRYCNIISRLFNAFAIGIPRSFAHDGIASYRLTLSRWRLFSVYTLTEAETLSRNLKEKEMSPMIKD